MESETITGKPCRIFGNNKFSKKHVGKKFTSWKCTDKNCNVLIHTDASNIVQEESVTHNHEDKVLDVAAHKLKVSCKRKADADFDTPPSKVIRRELQALGGETENIRPADLNAAKKSLWRKRAARHGLKPTTIQDTVERIKKFPLSTSRKEDFLMCAEQLSTKSAIIIFTCRSNLQTLCESDVILGDGTFFVVPKLFYQLYTLHVYNDGQYLPVLFALLPDKSAETYYLLIHKVYEQCALYSLSFLPKVILLDFEMAAISAFQSFFDDIDVQLCHFHWAQSVFRQITNHALKPAYTGDDTDVSNWLKMFFGLPLLPPDEVEDAFAEDIMANAPQDANVEQFCDYVCDTYITPESRYPPHMWARMPDDNQIPTTTNGAEAFHRHFKNCFQTAHPNIFALATELLALQEETYVKLYSQNRQRSQRSGTVQRRETIRKTCELYRSGQLTRAQYVQQISFKFLPVKV